MHYQDKNIYFQTKAILERRKKTFLMVRSLTIYSLTAVKRHSQKHHCYIMQMFGNSIKVGLQKVFTSLFCKSWINCYGIRAQYPSILILRFWYENTEVIGKGKTTIFFWWGTFGKASVHLKLTFKFKFKIIK